MAKKKVYPLGSPNDMAQRMIKMNALMDGLNQEQSYRLLASVVAVTGLPFAVTAFNTGTLTMPEGTPPAPSSQE